MKKLCHFNGFSRFDYDVPTSSTRPSLCTAHHTAEDYSNDVINWMNSLLPAFHSQTETGKVLSLSNILFYCCD